MAKRKKKQKECSRCNEMKPLSDYYVASNKIISSDGRLSICKFCLKDVVDYHDTDSIVRVMRMVDRPFLRVSYEASKANADPFGEYMRRLAMPQNRWLNYADSIFDGTDFVLPEHASSEVEFDAISLSDLKKRWGNYKDHNDYIYLENFYHEYVKNYATDTPAQRNIYKNIAKVQLEAEKELANGNTKVWTDLMKASSNLHDDAGIQPGKSNKKDDTDGLHSYGTWIEEIEKEEPAEYFEKAPAYEDYDSFKKYIDKWFVRPMKNIFNVSRDLDVKDDKHDKN